ncbi:kinase-like domain-containing protein [Immersiella caudata]|uniref:Kinase-like domain-containing protein n=1 Tax=Immersiella caudata TaxID=314043 RepID=A0AA39XD57_9PEZI|nr:kinase-like domain-containing protein [Immersiella caudata]
MATESYEHLCHRVYGQIYQRLQNKDAEHLRFATKGTAKKVLHRDNLLTFFRSLAPPRQNLEEHFGVSEDELLHRVHRRHLYDFLAVLIFARCRIETARTFAFELVAQDAWPVWRKGKEVGQLPAGREELVDLFDVADADMFVSTQPCFSAIILRKREEVRVADPGSQRLPYLNEQPLGNGSFGNVVRVRIAKGHFFDPQTKTENAEPLDIARKDYVLSSDFPARGEREIMEKILTSSGLACDNILENFGSLEIGQNTYSLFMPLAICDLRQYMMVLHKMSPRTISEKAKIIDSAEGLAGGLNFLHSEMKTSDKEDLVCYHMDLKPSNVLIFREERQGKECHIWRLSDFGMARVKLRRKDQDVEREKDFNSWFVRRQARPSDPSLSATLNRRGEGTYLAPESISSARSMGTASDVWSLACVLSVVFTYLGGGSDAVEQYQDARMNHPKADGYDRFFIRNKIFSLSKAHPEIHKWHDRLIREASKRDAAEGEAVQYMLRYLENGVFDLDQTKRRTAKDVQAALLATFKKYKSLGEVELKGPPEKSSPALRNNFFKNLMPLSRAKSPGQGQVEGWALSLSQDFKGCDISPDASLVVYWTDIKLVLYSSQSLSAGEAQVVSPVASHELEERDCIWRTVVVTSKYLIASTTGASFNCFIFELEGGDSVDVTLDHWYRLTLPLPEIYVVAISADCKLMSCILRDREDERHPGLLLTASISGLTAYAKRPRTSLTDSAVVFEPGGELWRLKRIKCSAPEVTHLSFSVQGEQYLVVQPELTARSREHRITILHVPATCDIVTPVIIESQGFDSSNTAGLFTTIAPFRIQNATCAFVTREKYLHIQSLVDDGVSPGVHKDIRHYRVLKLMMDSDDRLFALGTTSANQKLLLLELTVPRSPIGNVSVKEISTLPGLLYSDEVTQRISEEAGDKFVLVAALVAPNRRAIYRVRLGTENESA